MEINTGIQLTFVFIVVTVCFSVPYSIATHQKNKGMKGVFGYLVFQFGILAIAMFIFACFKIGSYVEAKAMLIEIPHIIANKTIDVFTN